MQAHVSKDRKEGASFVLHGGIGKAFAAAVNFTLEMTRTAV